MILNVLLGDLLVINLGIDLGRPDILIARHFLAQRTHTQREMNAMFAPRADIYLAFRLQARDMCMCMVCMACAYTLLPYGYSSPLVTTSAHPNPNPKPQPQPYPDNSSPSPGPHSPPPTITLRPQPQPIPPSASLQLTTKFIVITLLYSAALPICYVFCGCFMWVSMWIDRYNLLRRLVPPPRSPDALISLILRVIFPVAISLHLISSVIFYSFELALISNDPRCEAGEQPVVCRLDADPHRAPCQTAHTQAMAERAMRIIWLSLLVWGAMLAFYVTREARRKVDQGIHLINNDLVASYLDVITVQQDVKSQVLSEPEQIVKGALAQRYNTFRGQNGLRLYMPPLPPHVIQELRTVTAPNMAPNVCRSADLSASFSSVPVQRSASGRGWSL